MSFETPPPYGDDRESLPPIPPELDAPPPEGPPAPAPASKSAFWTWFIISALLNSIPILGLLTGFICIITGVIGSASSKNPNSRANFGGLAAGGAVGLMVSAGICMASISGGGV